MDGVWFLYLRGDYNKKLKAFFSNTSPWQKFTLQLNTKIWIQTKNDIPFFKKLNENLRKISNSINLKVGNGKIKVKTEAYIIKEIEAILSAHFENIQFIPVEELSDIWNSKSKKKLIVEEIFPHLLMKNYPNIVIKEIKTGEFLYIINR